MRVSYSKRIAVRADRAGPINALPRRWRVSIATIERVRERLVEGSLAAALNRHRSGTPRLRKLDGEQEAYLIALTCSQPEEGQQRWTLQMLADKLVELRLVESI